MAGDEFKKVRSGDPLRILAPTFNAFIDAAAAHRARQQDRSGESRVVPRQAGVIKVRNDSGAARERFDVLGIAAPLIDPNDNLLGFQEQVAVSGVSPTRAAHHGKFAILLEPLDVGAIGLAVASGVTVARVSVTTESESLVDVGDTPDALTTDQAGSAIILWKAPPASGPRWALVKIGLPARSAGSGSGSGSGSGTDGSGSGSGSGSDGSGSGSGSGGSGSGGSGSGGSGSGGSGSGPGSGTGGDGSDSGGSGTGGSGCKKSFSGNLADIPEGQATAGGWTVGIDENGCLVKYRHDPDTCNEEEG